jgi:hypothetical protein
MPVRPSSTSLSPSSSDVTSTARQPLTGSGPERTKPRDSRGMWRQVIACSFQRTLDARRTRTPWRASRSEYR